MRAYVIETPGGPEQLVLHEIPTPEPVDGEVLIRVRAFGLNRSEWFTRRGDSPSVRFPRVLGIECVGEVVAAPGTDLDPGQRVAAMMGGMGRAYDGSYAEYTRVPRAHVFPLETSLDWAVLGALPEMLQTTNGSLVNGLEIERASTLLTLLIRGGTSSIGLTALALAKDAGLEVATTTRTSSKEALLRDAGADHVLVDDGALAPRVREVFEGGADRVLELIGATTLRDSLRCAAPGGIVCMTGILGGAWVVDGFEPMIDIPTGVKLTSYSGGSDDIAPEALQAFIERVEAGSLTPKLGPSWRFEELVEAHRAMDENRSNGKMVVLVG
ncbi:MAG: zinc-binding dehydrogenase [Sandaracinaceae bacterium]|nr:zinc-binding dehydrogenase [Sandaracinaceae bacterium]